MTKTFKVDIQMISFSNKITDCNNFNIVICIILNKTGNVRVNVILRRVRVTIVAVGKQCYI